MAYGYRDTASNWDFSSSVASSTITTVTGDTLIGLTLGVGDLRTGTPTGASTTLTLTDSKGNTMARLGPAIYFSADDFTAQVWISQNIQNAGTSHSWTVAGAGSTACAVAVAAYSGLVAKYGLAAFSTNTQVSLGTGANAAVSGSDTNTGHANCLVLGFGYASEGLPNAGTGFTSRATLWPLGGGPNVLRIADLRATSVASQQATFTNTATSNNMTIMVVLKEDDADSTETLAISDDFSGSSGVDLSVYNPYWRGPNGQNELKGSNQAGPAVIGGGDTVEDTPLHRIDFVPPPDQMGVIEAAEFSTGYCAALTRCFDGLGFAQLTHYGHGVEAAGRNLYKQVASALTTFLSAAAPAEGVDIGCASVGKFHYGLVDGVVDLIAKDTDIAGGFVGGGSVADDSDVVRWANFRAYSIGADEGEILDIPYLVGIGTAVSGTGNVTPTWPAGHQADDIGLLLIESTGGEAANLGTASGFAAVANSPSNTGATTSGTRLTAYWCRATGSSQAAPVVTDPGNHAYARILVFRGCVTTGDPWDVTAAAQKASSSTSASAPTVTTTGSGRLAINAIARDNDSAAAAFSAWANANLVGVGEIADEGTAQGNGGGIGVAIGVKRDAGATGTTTATVTSSINASWTVALKPPGSGPSPVTLTVDGTAHGHAADAPSLTQANTLSVGEAVHAQLADAVALSPSFVLEVAGSAHAHAADGPELTQANVLQPGDVAHGHHSDSPDLTQDNTLQVGDSAHAHATDSVALVQANALAVADSIHSHAADAPVLSQSQLLAVGDSVHAIIAEALQLTQAHVLAIESAVHAHVADGIDLSTAGSLSVGSSAHGHHTDAVELVQAAILTVGDSAHTLVTASIALSQGMTLAVEEAIHAHVADGVVLTQSLLLAVASAVHLHAADEVDLTQATTIVVSDSVHAHIAQQINLLMPGGLPVPPGRTIVVQAKSRVIVIQPESRTIRVH